MTAQPPQKDPILTRFRAELDEIYGPRVERVVLFGSRARGDAQPDSDYDVAVFLRGYAPGTTTELVSPYCGSRPGCLTPLLGRAPRWTS
jgi:predicted nucleotidyltransferase